MRQRWPTRYDMGLSKDIADWIDTTVEGASALNITCVKGYPGWDRPDISLPIAAVWWVSDDAFVGERVGKRLDVYETVFTLAVYAESEPDLWTLLDRARTMFRANASATINSQRMLVTPGTFVRGPVDDAAVEQTRYSAQLPITFRYGS